MSSGAGPAPQQQAGRPAQLHGPLLRKWCIFLKNADSIHRRSAIMLKVFSTQHGCIPLPRVLGVRMNLPQAPLAVTQDRHRLIFQCETP